MYMIKNLVRGNRAADEFLLDWEDIELVAAEDGTGTVPALHEMTAEEAGEAEAEEAGSEAEEEAGEVEVLEVEADSSEAQEGSVGG